MARNTPKKSNNNLEQEINTLKDEIKTKNGEQLLILQSFISELPP